MTENRPETAEQIRQNKLVRFLIVVAFLLVTAALLITRFTNQPVAAPAADGGTEETGAGNEPAEPARSIECDPPTWVQELVGGELIQLTNKAPEMAQQLRDDGEKIDFEGNLEVANPPVCSEGYTFIWVYAEETDTEGFLIAGNGKKVWIEMVDGSADEADEEADEADDESQDEGIDPSDWLPEKWVDDGSDCPRSLITSYDFGSGDDRRILIGMVGDDNSTPNRVREYPGFPEDDSASRGNVVFEVPAGDEFLVLGPSVCQDGHMWMPILGEKNGQWTPGWMAEGSKNNPHVEFRDSKPYLSETYSGWDEVYDAGWFEELGDMLPNSNH